MKNALQNIDAHIKRRLRPPRQLNIANDHSHPLIIQTPQSFNQPDLAIQFSSIYFSSQRTTVDYETSATINANGNVLTYSHEETSRAGDYNFVTDRWEDDASPAWTIDEWKDHWLLASGNYYKITSNTADAVYITVEGNVPPEKGSITIVPFKTNEFKGAYLQPDTSKSQHRFTILSNTDTTITIKKETVHSAGSVTTGDAGAPYDTFKDSFFVLPAGDDDFLIDYYVAFTSGANSGTAKKITDFSATTGTFVVDAFAGVIAINDKYQIEYDMRWVSAGSTFVIEGFYVPTEADFVGGAVVSEGEVHRKTVQFDQWEIIDNNLGDYINAIYSVEVMSVKSGEISIPVHSKNSIKIKITEVDLSSPVVLADSGFRPNFNSSIRVNYKQNVWYRIDIYVYAEDGKTGFKLGEEFRQAFDYFRLPSPGVPASLTTTPGKNQMLLTWEQDESYKTEVYSSTDGVNYTWLATVGRGESRYVHTGLVTYGKYYYKLKHMNDTGAVSALTSQATGTVLQQIIPRTVTVDTKITLTDEGTRIFVNSGVAETITMPENTTENLPVGFSCEVVMMGAGDVDFAVEGSDNLNSVGGFTTINAQYQMVEVYKQASGEWWLFGDLK
jgi:hypothetical protein